MKRPEFVNEVILPQGVEAQVDGKTVKVKGPKGEVTKTLLSKTVAFEKVDNKILLKSEDSAKNFKRIVNTFRSHINGMVEGVTKGFVYKLKVCSGHFPMTIKIEKDKILINNFLGEKIPRVSKILEGAKVTQNGDVIIVEGIDLANVSQTAANLEIAVRIRNRDRRRFQDGIYLTEKAGVPI
ncbi:MAG: 50S ribosomal protein L6 [Candidatus Nanoarchaeia archaeon]|nr:50S ribosomal protein L6 [Candidatus Nanoarchaeia archaeon]